MPATATASPHHAAVNAHVAGFVPEHDADLIRFWRGEAAGITGYAEALTQHFESLVSGQGLDPVAVQGAGRCSEVISQAAAEIATAIHTFEARYAGTRADAANGTVMPYDGKFITGESA